MIKVFKMFSASLPQNLSAYFRRISLYLLPFMVCPLAAQTPDEIEKLKIDTAYNYFQFHSNNLGQRFANLFNSTNDKRAVVLHYGASHIQAEIVTTNAKKLLHERFGNAGPGFVFNFAAAKTYSSINYSTRYDGVWEFAKSFQIPPKLPLGVRGMTVQTANKNAALYFAFKEPFPVENYELTIFFDNDEFTPDYEIQLDATKIVVNDSVRKLYPRQNHLTFPVNQSLASIQIVLNDTLSRKTQFRFYGLTFEHTERKGLLYHSLGVGAAPMEAVLHLEKLQEQAYVLQPDMVLLDFGTNNILYKNEVKPNLAENIVKAIQLFREINPDIIVVLTSTQDLFYKGRHIDAGVTFNLLVDSIAKTHDCMFWNFYDLTGGFTQITNWRALDYAQPDHIHLTTKGYQIKGNLLYQSITNSLNYINRFPEADSLSKKPQLHTELLREHKNKSYEKVKNKSPSGGSVYRVKSGDTLTGISKKYGVSVAQIKRLNGLPSDLIRAGQVLKLK